MLRRATPQGGYPSRTAPAPLTHRKANARGAAYAPNHRRPPPAAKTFPPNPQGGVCGFGGEGFRAANPQTPPARPKPDRRHQPHGKRIYGGRPGCSGRLLRMEGSGEALPQRHRWWRVGRRAVRVGFHDRQPYRHRLLHRVPGAALALAPRCVQRQHRVSLPYQ